MRDGSGAIEYALNAICDTTDIGKDDSCFKFFFLVLFILVGRRDFIVTVIRDLSVCQIE